MRKLLDAIFGKEPGVSDKGLDSYQRLTATDLPAVIYAIGDVHGHLNLLKALERQIFDDGALVGGEKWIVMLGDYIDRGPQSAQVIDHLLEPLDKNWQRICLCGNHEHAMALSLRDKGDFKIWLDFGGIETLMSYGITFQQINDLQKSWPDLKQVLDTHIPMAHRKFLASLASMLRVPGYVFVHAGLRPGISLDHQSDNDLLWIRNSFIGSEFDFGSTVVHGHTAIEEPYISPRRINIDTGAYATGCLTAIRIMSNQPHKIFQVRA